MSPYPVPLEEIRRQLAIYNSRFISSLAPLQDNHVSVGARYIVPLPINLFLANIPHLESSHTQP
ncbi:MAG: hypothetical protein WAV05_17545 [Anaerolineales bacterium]